MRKIIPNTNNRYYAEDDGKIYDIKYQKYINQNKNKKGYLQCHIWMNNKRITIGVHRLIALTFLGYSDLTVNHKDGNKENNNISNLEYMTIKEQNIHRSKILFKGNQRKIKCIENNIIYHNAKEAAAALNIHTYNHICKVCSHKYGFKTVNGYHFEYINN